MWLYEVGHKQLVLRSVKSKSEPTRVDILFKNVRSIRLPTTMDGLSISRAGHGFVVGGVAWNGLIEAGACFVGEDDGEYFEPSPSPSHCPERPLMPRTGPVIPPRTGAFERTHLPAAQVRSPSDASSESQGWPKWVPMPRERDGAGRPDPDRPGRRRIVPCTVGAGRACPGTRVLVYG
jgi:hypothetical protein